MVPGSHRLGLLDTVPHPATPMVHDARITDDAFRPLLMARGDVAVLSGFLVHRTGERGDARVRVALSLRYNNADEPSFVARGYPSPYSYSYQLELITEGFPKADDIRRVFPGD